MNIPKPVINTFERVGIDYKKYMDESYESEKVQVRNWLTDEPCMVHPLIAICIAWVYKTQLEYERGNMKCTISDFDRVRHFILKVDPTAYMTCID